MSRRKLICLTWHTTAVAVSKKSRLGRDGQHEHFYDVYRLLIAKTEYTEMNKMIHWKEQRDKW